MPRQAPQQKPGHSKQDFPTPWEFIRAVEERFGELALDLAATRENKKADSCFTPESDSLSISWHMYAGNLWLNPPFAHIAPWAAKCEEEMRLGAKILLLTPASVGSNWYRDHIHNKARVLFLNGRITFEGQKDCYPKDLMLSCFGWKPGFEVWTWNKKGGSK